MSDRSRQRMAALVALRQQLASAGLLVKAPGRILLQLAWHVVVAVGGMAVFFLADNVLWRICGLLVSTAGSIGVGTNSHTSSHYATSERRWVNEALTFFGYPFFLGLSASFWWRKHVVVHHPMPNVIGVDEDADFMPWLAMTERDVRSARGVRRYYYEHLQWFLFPILLVGNGFNMQRSGWAYLVGCLRQKAQRKAFHWIDLGCLVAHLAISLGLPLLIASPAEVAVGYVLRITLMGYAMFAVLGPGHLPAEAVRLTAGQDADYLLLQTATTVNFRTRFVGRLLCSGLEFQIEHHLFPNISHVHYPAVARMVREFCRQHALPYHSSSWPVALWRSWDVFRHPLPIQTDLEHPRVTA